MYSRYLDGFIYKLLFQVKAPAYYMGTPAPSTLPRGGSLLRAFSPAAPAPPTAGDRTSTLPAAGTYHTSNITFALYLRTSPRASSRVAHGSRWEMSFRLQPCGGIAFIIKPN
ncbi:hypothetical protein MSG28_000814 [Choristoneura fumiferana]|uniref:Uncharacterized protein n=3 Tax=Choristoneura fumiferana TaxID=7141 RepID=A0ACC0K2B7_CHOFU|nr:hypothetical protein MSG28_000814 [Choristoneura fumiferana]KAI8430598.1 hypothetical protein MSG28_000814 [Choristoneura fumiferana]KAI8430599.1 hypothetical protein MSG28_000814 [Choristoneura fumiferana]